MTFDCGTLAAKNYCRFSSFLFFDHTGVYLLRRVANLPLREVAKHGNVSPSQISKIQRAIEAQKIPASLQKLLDKCNVKN